MARPRKYTDEQIIAALKKKKGMVFLAAAAVGCDPSTIHDRAKVSEVVRAVIANERGKVVDTAEMKLFGAITKGEPWAIQMALKTIGKDRGYVERPDEAALLAEMAELRQTVRRLADERDGAARGGADAAG